MLESEAVRKQLLPYSYGQDKVLCSSHLIVFAAHTDIGDTIVDRYIDQHIKITQTPRSALANYSDHMKSALADKTPAQRQEWAHQQAYIALGNLLTCAALMRIDSCPMTGIDFKGYDTVLGLQEQNLTTTVVCAIGRRHPDDAQALRPKVRFDYDTIVKVI